MSYDDLLKDAERYRWLRDTQYEEGVRFNGEPESPIGSIDSIYVHTGDGGSTAPHPEELDAAIDSEMLKHPLKRAASTAFPPEIEAEFQKRVDLFDEEDKQLQADMKEVGELCACGNCGAFGGLLMEPIHFDVGGNLLSQKSKLKRGHTVIYSVSLAGDNAKVWLGDFRESKHALEFMAMLKKMIDLHSKGKSNDE